MSSHTLYRLEVRRKTYEATRKMLDGLGLLDASREYETTRPKRVIFEWIMTSEASRKEMKTMEENIRRSLPGYGMLYKLPIDFIFATDADADDWYDWMENEDAGFPGG